MDATTRTGHDAFLALVCADPELLDAEFDAIIGANWGSPPTAQPAPRPAPETATLARSAGSQSREPLLLRDVSGPQRSPPIRCRNVA